MSDLDANQRATLRSAIRTKDRSELRLRATVLGLLAEGAPQAAVARELGITRQLLRAWLKRWERERAS